MSKGNDNNTPSTSASSTKSTTIGMEQIFSQIEKELENTYSVDNFKLTPSFRRELESIIRSADYTANVDIITNCIKDHFGQPRAYRFSDHFSIEESAQESLAGGFGLGQAFTRAYKHGINPNYVTLGEELTPDSLLASDDENIKNKTFSKDLSQRLKSLQKQR